MRGGKKLQVGKVEVGKMKKNDKQQIFSVLKFKTIVLIVFVLIAKTAQNQDNKEIAKFNFSDCKNDCEIGIISLKQKLGRLNLSIGVHENCCMKFEVSGRIINDTLEITYHKYGQPCRCNCNYQMDMVILKTKKKHYKTIGIKGRWHKDWDTPEKRAEKFSE